MEGRKGLEGEKGEMDGSLPSKDALVNVVRIL